MNQVTECNGGKTCLLLLFPYRHCMVMTIERHKCMDKLFLNGLPEAEWFDIVWRKTAYGIYITSLLCFLFFILPHLPT